MTVKPERTRWGLARLTDERGRVGGAFPAATLRVPPFVELVDDNLVWRLTEREVRGKTFAERFYDRQLVTRPPTPVEPMPHVLDQFVKLRDTTPNRILQFARRWGVLGLCHHGLPANHWLCPWIEWSDHCRQEQQESMETWREYARLFSSFLTCRAVLGEGKRPQMADLHGLMPSWIDHEEIAFDWLTEFDFDGNTIEDDWSVYLLYLDALIATANVRMSVTKQGKMLLPRMTAGGLFATLVGQLVLTLCRSDGPAICSACGTTYLPERRPATGRRSYCPDCGAKAAQRDAARDYRRRKTEEKTARKPKRKRARSAK